MGGGGFNKSTLMAAGDPAAVAARRKRSVIRILGDVINSTTVFRSDDDGFACGLVDITGRINRRWLMDAFLGQMFATHDETDLKYRSQIYVFFVSLDFYR